jgi:3-oxo-5-alpha-steroid 4-dehydrogenase 1
MTTLLGFDSLEEEQRFHTWLSISAIIVSVPIFLLLYLVVPSPWGKTATNRLPSSLQLVFGPTVPARLAWFVYESPNLAWSLICFARRSRKLDRVNALLFSLYVVHYIQRTLLYPLIMKPGRKGIPLTTATIAFIYCNVNGYLQARSLCEFDPQGDSFVDGPFVILGLILFGVGAAVNLHSDYILRKLSGRGSGYQIPFGGCFRYVSTPHFFGEIVEWGGFCMASRCTLASTSFWLFTMANLIPRGVAHHRWYQDEFKDKYPRGRKAVIPFLY